MYRLVSSIKLVQNLKKDQDLLESTQKFACKMITKNWDKGYDELLYMTDFYLSLQTEG